jgi:threonine dehydratase
MQWPAFGRRAGPRGLDDQRRQCGQGVAFAARKAGIPCSVVAIETAPQTKLERMRALGATIVPVSYEQAWKAAEAHAYEGVAAHLSILSTTTDFIAGHGTMGWRLSSSCRESAP